MKCGVSRTLAAAVRAGLLLSALLGLDEVDASWPPENGVQLHEFVEQCLAENLTGDCAGMAAARSYEPDGPTYGAIGDWDVSKVRDMSQSTRRTSAHSTPTSSLASLRRSSRAGVTSSSL